MNAFPNVGIGKLHPDLPQAFRCLPFAAVVSYPQEINFLILFYSDIPVILQLSKILSDRVPITKCRHLDAPIGAMAANDRKQ